MSCHTININIKQNVKSNASFQDIDKANKAKKTLANKTTYLCPIQLCVLRACASLLLW